VTGYILRRLGIAVIVLLGITLVTFGLLHAIAPSPGRIVLGTRAAPAAVAAYNRAHGYDRPLVVQFGTYLGQLGRGDLGTSAPLNQSVSAILREKASLSAFLSGVSLLLAVLVAIPLGIYQAVRRNTVGDSIATGLSFTLYSMPVFLFGLLLISVFVFKLHWVDANVPQSQSLLGSLRHAKDLILPVVALAALFGGFATPVKAAALTALYALLTATVIHRDLHPLKDVPRVMTECGLLIGGVLLILGVAMGLVVASIHEKREEFRRELQQAAGEARPAQAGTTGPTRDPPP